MPNPPRKLPNPTLGVGVQALFGTQTVGIPITQPLVDKTAIGSFWIRHVLIGSGQTLVNIELPRQPSGVVIVDNNNGSVVFRNSSDVNACGPSTYACRATSAVSVWGLFF